MKRLLAIMMFAAVSAGTTSAHHDSGTQPSGQAQTPAASQKAGTGLIQQIDKERDAVTIKHGPLQGLNMPATTMSFLVKDKAMLSSLQSLQKVDFELTYIDFAQQLALRPPRVRYEPTPADVVQAMLRLAGVSADDVVYDLGCGDGRIVIAAVRQSGARGVCVDNDPRRIAESRENARQAGVTDLIRFRNEDLLKTDLGDATVVMLFLTPKMNLALRPRLLRELKPGSRIVSHGHDMGDWKPQEIVRVLSGGQERPIYLWTR